MGGLTSYPAEDDLVTYHPRHLALEDLIRDLQKGHRCIEALLSALLTLGREGGWG
jgi:hypothetical protein